MQCPWSNEFRNDLPESAYGLGSAGIDEGEVVNIPSACGIVFPLFVSIHADKYILRTFFHSNTYKSMLIPCILVLNINL